MNYIKQNHLSLLIILGLVIFGIVTFRGSLKSLFVGAAPQDLTTVGNPWNFTNIQSPGGVTLASTTVTSSKVGQSGTKLTLVLSGTCDLQANVSITATSTQFAFCTGITGLVAGDRVFIAITSTSTAIGTQYVPIAVAASSTAGAFDVKFLNLTGATGVPAAQSKFGSTTPYQVFR